MEAEESTTNPHYHQKQNQVMQVLQVLKEASQILQDKPQQNPNDPSSFSFIQALLDFETESDLFSTDPNLSALSRHLTHLKSLLHSQPHHPSIPSLLSFLRRRASHHQISRVAASIESEIQSWIDRETVNRLVLSLSSSASSADDDNKNQLLAAFEIRISQGFDRDLQDLVLKSKTFESVESALCNPAESKRVREQAARVIAALVRFNKDVFVGQVLMGPTVRALVAMATADSIVVLCGLVRSIKSALVDDIEIPKIINLLNVEDTEIRIAAIDLIMEIGYFGRKEAIEAMLEEGLVKKLVELQRSDGGGSLIEIGGDGFNEEEEGVSVERMEKAEKSKERRWLERHPFASCVARFAIQMEVGEGLRQRERRAFKQEVLNRVREAVISDAEAATILAEVLWGSSP
ncbi:hypothetical protein AAC387_Pa04g1313 [Persea americana]